MNKTERKISLYILTEKDNLDVDNKTKRVIPSHNSAAKMDDGLALSFCFAVEGVRIIFLDQRSVPAKESAIFNPRRGFHLMSHRLFQQSMTHPFQGEVFPRNKKHPANRNRPDVVQVCVEKHM